MKYILLGMALLSFSVSAAYQSGNISGYIPYSNGHKEIIIFKLNNNVAEGCNTTGRFAMDSNSPRYKATLSAIIAAFHSQTKVRVKYTPTCDSWGNSADAELICVGNIDC